MIPAGNEFFMTEVMEWQHEKDGAQGTVTGHSHIGLCLLYCKEERILLKLEQGQIL